MNKKGEICEYWQPAEETLPIEKREAIQGLGLRILDLRGAIYRQAAAIKPILAF